MNLGGAVTKNIADWLKKLGMSEYVQRFDESRIDFSVLRELTDQDLKELGVVLGDRRRMLRAIGELDKATTSAAKVSTKATPQETAERRQLTLMFCDLVGSTAMSTRFDPEDMRGIVGAYHRCCASIIASNGGFVAKYMGDGVLAYFGYPKAHEHDAERAVRAGLAIVEAAPKLETAASSPLHVRIGIATGIVVVGDLLGLGEARERSVVGETPNLAARLQGIAEPDNVVIGDGTRRLLGNLFELKELGATDLKGIAGPVQAWGVLRARSVESRFEALHTSALGALVGRDPEIELLLDRWHKATDGEGQVVMLSSQPGIGKSRLTRALAERLSGQDFVRLLYYCSPYHTNSALYPVVQQFQRAAGFSMDDSVKTKLKKLDALMNRFGHKDAMPLLAHLLSIPTRHQYSELSTDPQERRKAVLAQMVELLADLAHRQPVLIIAEDLHWIDPTSLEFLQRLVSRIGDLRVLMIVTLRPEFSLQWTGDHVTAITLNGLNPQQSTDLVRRLTQGKPLPDEMLAQIVARTDGVPLFIEELTKTIVESGVLLDKGDRYEIGHINPSMAIPATLRDSLLARLDRLDRVKEVAQIGAVIGREFPYELLSVILPIPARELRNTLRRLTEAALLFVRGRPPRADYTFKHMLIQETAYDSLLRSRRIVLHSQIANALHNKFPDISTAQPELLAHHYTLAGDAERAVEYWLKAGRRSTERSTGAEAINHLEKALEVLQTLPDTSERARKELDLRIALLTPTISIRGYGSHETEQIIARARAIAEKVGEATQLYPVMYGEWAFNIVSGRIQNSRQLAEQYMLLAQNQPDKVPLLVGHRMLGTSLASTGELSLACDQFKRVLTLYDPRLHMSSSFIYGQDSLVTALTFLALTLLILGAPKEAIAAGQRALEYADELKHPNTQGVALCLAGALLQEICRNVPATRKHTIRIGKLAQSRSLGLWLITGRVFESWVLGQQGRWGEAIIGMRKTLDEHKASGTYLIRSHFLGLLAELYQGAGQPMEGLAAVEEAFTVAHKTGERMWEADLYRLKGDLLLARDGVQITTAAESCFAKAIEIARSQGAKLWELRARVSLAHLWIGQGKGRLVREMLEPLYRSFDDSLDVHDVTHAAALLRQLQ
jgi:class 3 adenylate cyclase/predicted ATPase